MLALCVTVCLILVGGEVVQPVPIAVFALGYVTDSLVNRICAEASAIWGPAGITFEWRRVGSEAEASNGPFEIIIDDRRANVQPRCALGWITFTANSPERAIHLSRGCAEDLVVTTHGLNEPTIASHETLIGRALGRALAHEVGHLLLRSKTHTSRGLMRAIWSGDDSFGFRRRGFELTAEQRAAAIGYLAGNGRGPTPNGGNHVDQAGIGQPQFGDSR